MAGVYAELPDVMNQHPSRGSDVHVLLATDDTYAAPLAAALHSAAGRVLSQSSVTVLLNGVSRENRRRLQRCAPDLQIDWQAPDIDTGKFVGGRGVSVTTYLKLFADEVLPPDRARALYLDADVLIRSDLAPLFSVDLEGRPIGACRDMVIAQRDHPYSHTLNRDAKPYFNAGVMLLDLAQLRAGLGEELRRTARSRPSGEGNFDQDVLNDVLDGNWLELDPTWNVQSSLFLLQRHPLHPWVAVMRQRRSAISKEAAIVHFSGRPKPWQARSTHPFRHEWRRALQSSGWFSGIESIRWRVAIEAKGLGHEVLAKTGRRERWESTTG